ncbi:MAG: B12-binding domain-containing radical SAM protein [Acidobacteria bacterium]|nr:B12-binding domain-containing radical SAM protein [Acidobacteriota bacterium]
MNILLVYPEFPDTYWSFRYALAFEGKRAAFPPLGLLTISALLPANWQRRLVDLNIYSLQVADLRWADVVFISAMIVQKDSLGEIIKLCKAHGKRVVVGGPYITTSSQDVGADHIFLGEAETTLPEFVRDLESGQVKRVYQALERPSLSASPIPDFQLADLQKYSAMSVQYSRGCPFQCEFCDIIEIYGRKPRTKSNEQILAELNKLYDLGWRGMVFLVDDNFIGNKRQVKTLLPTLAAWSKQHNNPFSFITEASVNLAEDEELLRGMQEAGFRRVFLGIETPVEASLKEAQKGQNLQSDLLTSVRKIQSYGMEVMAGFIIGFDNDPEDIFDRQIEFIRASAIPLAMVGLLTALPGTQLWRRLAREERLLTESSGNNTDGSLNFVPKTDARQLTINYQEMLRTLYSPHEYYQRALDSLDRVRVTSVEPRRNGRFSDVITFARVVLQLGIRDPSRSSFWRYLSNVAFQRRQRFAEAIRLAALGYHFRKLADVCFPHQTK